MVHFPSLHVLTQGTEGSYHSCCYTDLSNGLKDRLRDCMTGRMTGRQNVSVKRLVALLRVIGGFGFRSRSDDRLYRTQFVTIPSVP